MCTCGNKYIQYIQIYSKQQIIRGGFKYYILSFKNVWCSPTGSGSETVLRWSPDAWAGTLTEANLTLPWHSSLILSPPFPFSQPPTLSFIAHSYWFSHNHYNKSNAWGQFIYNNKNSNTNWWHAWQSLTQFLTNYSPFLPSLLLILTLPLSVYRLSVINGTLFEEIEHFWDGMFNIWDVTVQIHSLFSEECIWSKYPHTTLHMISYQKWSTIFLCGILQKTSRQGVSHHMTAKFHSKANKKKTWIWNKNYNCGANFYQDACCSSREL